MPTFSEDKKASKVAYRYLRQLAKRGSRWSGIAVLLGVVSSLCLIWQALLLANVVQTIYIARHFAVTHSLVMILILVLVRAALSWGKNVTGFKASQAVRETLREELSVHLLQVNPAELATRSAAGVVSIGLDAINKLAGFFSQYLPQMALSVLVPIAILCFVFPVSWIAGGILLLTAFLIPFFMALIGMGVESLNQKNFQEMARMSSYFLNVLRGLSTLKLFYVAVRELKKVAKVSEDFRVTTMKVLRIAFLSSAVLELFSSLSIALLAVYLGLSLLSYIHVGFYGHVLSLKGALFVLLLAPEFYFPLRKLGKDYHARAEAIGAAKEIARLMDLPVFESPVCSVPEAGYAVAFTDVVLKRGEHEVVSMAGFHVPVGKLTVLVGVSGSGKTSLLDCMAGFLVPAAGEVKRLEGAVAYLRQNPRLLCGTVAENLRYANPKATDQNLAEVMHLAAAESIPLDQSCLDENAGLSGGQVQRVCLARTLLQHAPLLLLDEPTASLDEAAEATVMTHLKALGQTVVLASHRPQTIAAADYLVLVDVGKVIGAGAPATLQTEFSHFLQEVSHA